MLSRKKILFLTTLIFLLSLAFPAYVFAAGTVTFLGKPVIDIVNELIKLILSLVGRISLLILVLGGIFYVTSESSPENQERAKKVVSAALFGLILVLVSYALISVVDKIFVK